MTDSDFCVDDAPLSVVTTPRKCTRCGKKLSIYNNAKICFHHAKQIAPREHSQAQQAQLSNVGQRKPPQLITTQRRDLGTTQRIMHLTCKYFKIDRAVMMQKNRKAPVALARQVLMYLLYTDGAHSYPSIARILGGRDHTTILHGVRKIKRKLQTDTTLAETVRVLRENLTKPPTT